MSRCQRAKAYASVSTARAFLMLLTTFFRFFVSATINPRTPKSLLLFSFSVCSFATKFYRSVLLQVIPDNQNYARLVAPIKNSKRCPPHQNPQVFLYLIVIVLIVRTKRSEISKLFLLRQIAFSCDSGLGYEQNVLFPSSRLGG